MTTPPAFEIFLLIGELALTREQLVYYGIGMEVGLLLLSAILNLLWPIPVELDPLRTSTLLTNFGAILFGLTAAVGMFGIGLLLWYVRISVLQKMRQFLMEEMAPAMSQCHIWETILVALSAGVGEEVLFRGVLQPRIGWIAASVLFGLLHAISPTYIVVAFSLSVILAWIQIAGGNLWASIIAHAVYDYCMFLVLIRAYRRQQRDAAAQQQFRLSREIHE
jgi:membrane protease YdiL (CAAX protease family)